MVTASIAPTFSRALLPSLLPPRLFIPFHPSQSVLWDQGTHFGSSAASMNLTRPH